jgi:hypothetical protein
MISVGSLMGYQVRLRGVVGLIRGHRSRLKLWFRAAVRASFDMTGYPLSVLGEP